MAVKSCWAITRRGSSLKSVMKLTEINHDRSPYAVPWGMGTLCTGKKAPIYGDGDTLHWQKGPHIWAWDTLRWPKGPHIWTWGHFALAKRPTYMGIGILCTGAKLPAYGHWDDTPHYGQ